MAASFGIRSAFVSYNLVRSAPIPRNFQTFKTLKIFHRRTGASVNQLSKSFCHNDQLNDQNSTKDVPAEERSTNDMEGPSFFAPVSPDRASHEMLMITKPNQPLDAHVLRVAIIGSPNAGKSTLINSLLGRRIFSVSKKVHTTRTKATAVVTSGRTQIIILDTPGIVSFKHGRKHHLPRPLLVDPKNVLEEADIVAVLVDAGNKWTCNTLDPNIMMALHQKQDVPAVLVLNKVDLLKNKQLLFEIVSDLTEGVVGGKEFDLGKNWSNVKDKSLEREENVLKEREKRDRFEEILDDRTKLEESQKLQRETDGTTNGDNSNLDSECFSRESIENVRHGHVEEGDYFFEDGSSQTTSRLVNRTNCDSLYSSSSVDKGDEIIRGMEDNYQEFQDETEQSASSLEMENVQTEEGEDNSCVLSHTSGCGNAETTQRPSLQLSLQLGDSQKEATMLEFIGHLNEIDGKKMYSKSVKEDSVDEEDLAKQRRKELNELMKSFKHKQGWPKFKEVFMISALNKDGVDNLKDYFIHMAKPGYWEYHSDTVTDLPPEEIVNDAIREKLLEHLPQEVPYKVTQVNELWKVGEDGELQIYHRLICHKKTHVGMIERRMGNIVQDATQDLMNAFHCEVLLKVYVTFQKH
ncbi:GTPase Era, mitochondrial [Holothuria leucospilota]|uniref:GTPase Era, mitochondrial n=1 Tax=Holothuria leucospilota TaxID=206669 RepID=A0A9Q1HG56_HOLLE|nr:GTPase Era, mitochondrial [Holothuria leucospilota]